MDFYYSIDKTTQNEIKIKGSRFIAHSSPVINKEDAMQFLSTIKKLNYNATHNCFAYIIGWNEAEFRFSDDGEPTNSAGKPILYTIKKFGLSDIIVVVTRYFGGTKLGIGGLVKAYSEATESVLNIVDKKIIHRTIPFVINCHYENINTLKKIISEFAVSYKIDFADIISITADIPMSKNDAFISTVYEATKGTITPKTNPKTADYTAVFNCCN